MNTYKPSDPITGTPSREPAGTAPDADRLKADAGALAETAKRDLDKVRREAESGVEELKHQAQAQLSQATDKVRGMATEQKDYVAGQLGTVADAIGRVADELGGEQQATAGYARTVADGVRQLADTVRERDLDDLVATTEDFGRRQPVAFMGAAALAGFAASRFLLASSKRRSAQTELSTQSSTDFGSTASSYPDGGDLSTRGSLGGTVR